MSLFEAGRIVQGEAPAEPSERVRALEDRIVELEARNDELGKALFEKQGLAVRLIRQHNDMLGLCLKLGLRPVQTEIAEHVVYADGKPPREIAFDVEVPVEAAEGATFADYAALWMDRNRDWSDGTRRVYESKLRRHILPKLGGLPVSAVTPRMLADVANAVSNGTRGDAGARPRVPPRHDGPRHGGGRLRRRGRKAARRPRGPRDGRGRAPRSARGRGRARASTRPSATPPPNWRCGWSC